MSPISSAGRLAPAIALVLALAACDDPGTLASGADSRVIPIPGNEEYAPVIVPADFVPGTPNPFFPLLPGTTYRYLTDDGEEINDVEITAATKTILGVTTVVVHDRVWLDENGNGIADGASCGAPGFTAELIEETFDWFAPDNGGTVWYFGEDSKEYDHCTLVSTEGSWEAGVGGAQPGRIMLASPVVGQSYRQEFAEGTAEDFARVTSLAKSVSVPFGDFTGCLETMEWTPLEPGSRARKYYCSGVGFVLEVTARGGRGRTELVAKTP